MANYEVEIQETKEIKILNDIRFNLDLISDFEGENENHIDIMTIENGKFNEDYHNFITGVEFNDLPKAMETFLKEYNK